MTKEVLLQKLQWIRQSVSQEDYPGIHAVLENIDIDNIDKDDAFSSYENSIGFARNLQGADMEKPMPAPVADFVKEVYEEAIASGSAEAALNLGIVYYTGRIGEQNFTKAVELYNLAAERGDRQATENLGYCYYYGRDVAVDYEKAFHYFALGAFDGHLISLYKIGDMYRYGYYSKRQK